MITKRFGRGALVVFIENVIVALVGLVYYILLAHLLPLEVLGILSILTFSISILGILMNLSISTVAAQKISAARGKEKPEEIPSVTRSSLQLVLIFSSTIFLLCLILALVIQPAIDPILLIPLLLIPAIGSFRITYFSFLIGLEKFGLKAVFSVIVFLITKFLGILLIIYFGVGIFGILLGWFIGETIVLILSASVGKIPVRGGSRLAFMNLVVPGLAVSTILFLYGFFDYIDRLLYFFGIGDLAGLGAYELTIRLLGPLVSLTVVISSVSLPILSHTVTRNTKDVSEFISTLLRFYFILFLPLCVFLALTLQGRLLFLVYGTVWLGMEVVFVILIIASFFQGLLLLGVRLLQALGGKNEFFKIGIPVIALDLLITWAIIPFWGAIGIAFIRLGSYAVASILIFYFVWRRTGPKISANWAFRLGVTAIIIVISVSILNLLPIYPWLLFLSQVLIVFIIFTICIKLFNLISEGDRTRLLSAFPFLRRIIVLLA